jgi:hypothetical protein
MQSLSASNIAALTNAFLSAEDIRLIRALAALLIFIISRIRQVFRGIV